MTAAESMKLVVGLGNPGRKYEGTRHNVGFAVMDEVARKWAATGPKSKFNGQIVEAHIEGLRALLLWPQTFMNLSGSSVGNAFRFFQLDFDDVLVVCDDFQLPLAKLRFRAQGSAGGQKGLADIIRCLGTQEIARLRIGIGTLPEGQDAANYVLNRFTAEEHALIQPAIRRAAQGVVDWVREGTKSCMNRYNADP